MVDPFLHIDKSFKNAFEHWEAPHSPAEMHAGWDQVANHLPHIPHTPSAGHAAGHVAGGAGKIIGISAGIGAAVVATVAVLYNIYVKPIQPNQTNNSGKTSAITGQSQQSSNPAVAQNNNNPESGSITTDKSGTKNEVARIQPQPNNAATSPVIPFGPAATTNGLANLVPQQTNSFNNLIKPVQPKPQSSVNQVQSMKLILSDTLVCSGVKVTATSNISYPGVTIEWGDGNWNEFSGQNVHVYAHPGTFRAHLTIDSIRADRKITVLSSPKARFTVTKGENLACSFGNNSVNADRYAWNYGDEDNHEPGFYANHTYQDTGRYEVQLVAINSTGCSDTATQIVNIRQFSEPTITRNVITPNGDGDNDDVGVNIEGETSFQFTIMDATGKKVFQTTDKNKHWNGQNQFTGAECKQGDYYYTITYSFNQSSPPKPKTGNITLIRSKN